MSGYRGPSALRRQVAASLRAKGMDIHLHGRRMAITSWKLDEWRTLGEAGQLLAGLHAGFTPEEVAQKRGWDDVDFDRYAEEAAAYLRPREAQRRAEGGACLDPERSESGAPAHGHVPPFPK